MKLSSTKEIDSIEHGTFTLMVSKGGMSPRDALIAATKGRPELLTITNGAILRERALATGREKGRQSNSTGPSAPLKPLASS